MKKILFYLVSSISIILCACTENKPLEVGQKTTMEIDSVFNAGTVVKGEIIHATFKVRNTGDYPLVFGEVRASCGCTVPSKPQKPIQPGETSQITAEVNTANLTSKQIIKSVTTMSNTEPNIHLLKIKAKIK
jgi:hypothetical protein